jgi:hypothetical protein
VDSDKSIEYWAQEIASGNRSLARRLRSTAALIADDLAARRKEGTRG